MPLQKDIEAGIIKIDGQVLPGALQRLVVGHQIIIDEIEIQDKDGHLKQPAGYDEGTISIELDLLGSDADEDGDNAYEVLETIQTIFRKTEGQMKPEIHDIANIHTAARGIKQVLFKTLETESNSETNILSVRIELEEYIPLAVQVVQAVERAQEKQQLTDQVSQATGAPPAGQGAGTPGDDAGR